MKALALVLLVAALVAWVIWEFIFVPIEMSAAEQWDPMDDEDLAYLESVRDFERIANGRQDDDP